MAPPESGVAGGSLGADGRFAAARAYGLDPGALRPVASRYRLAAAWLAGSVLLKPYRYGERQLYYATRALLHMEARRFPLVPRLVHSRRGEPYIQVGGTWWYATTWIEGRPPALPRELGPAAQSLAAFHLASEGEFIPWSPRRSWRMRWSELLRDLVAFRRLAEAGDAEFDRRYATAAPAFIQRAEEAVASLDPCGYDRLEEAVRRRRAFCHRDCTAANLIVNQEGYICLVDPDTWGPELRLHDLTRLLLSGGSFDSRLVLGAVAAYEALAPLDPAERALLPAALLLPREFWWAGVCRWRRPEPGVDPERLLHETTTGAPMRDACVQELFRSL